VTQARPLTPVAKRRRPRPRPKTRAELLQREKETWDELAATWCKLPDAALTQPGACGPGWSVKDVLNHIAAWQEAALRILPQLLAGQRATLGASTDRFNAQQQAADRDRSLRASKRRLNQSRRELLALLDTIPDPLLLDQSTRVNWWVRYTLHAHYGEHIWELQQFRQRLLQHNR
jgi:hypothetical protein